jgi:predicted RNA-binding Zn ribbon-like protein
MSGLPTWASHVEDKRAPMPLLLVQAFVDTLDLENGTDILAHAEEARTWLTEAGLTRAGQAKAGQALGLAREVRESLRALIRHSTNGQPLSQQEMEPLRRILDQSRPRLEVTADGRVEFEAPSPARTLADGLLGLLLIVRDAQADGSWERLKLCGNPDCLWAFYDRSHSRRGAWCDMASCGNRLKNRNLRARRAQLGSIPGGG